MLIRLLAASIFGASAVAKFSQLILHPFSNDFHGMPRWGVVAVATFETTLGIWLATGVRQRAARVTSISTFAVFTCYAAYATWIGQESCGCFGDVSIKPWMMLPFDLMAIVALIYWSPTAKDAGEVRGRPLLGATSSEWRSLIGFTAIGSAAVLALVSADNFAVRRHVANDLKEWIGQPFPLNARNVVTPQLEMGNSTVLLYHNDCPRCREAIASLKLEKSESLGMVRIPRRVLLLEAPPYADEEQAFHGSGFIHGRVRDGAPLFARLPTPLLIDVKDGIVRSATQL